MRIPVVDSQNQSLMPTKPSRARKWIRLGKAIGKFNNLGQFYVQLVAESSGSETQSIVIGIDPGKLYSGIGVQSSKVTLFTAHLVLPFQKVKDRMEQRAMMRRTRRGRRINRKIAFKLRAHRQKRFDNRRGSKLPPSIRANRQLELRVVSELCKVLPVSGIVYEVVEAKGSKSFSPIMVGQKWMLTQLAKFATVETCKGWKTSQLRTQLGLEKQKHQKGDPILETHAVDGIALACSAFIHYESFHSTKSHGHQWTGEVLVTAAPFKVIRRPPISRRQLHLIVPAKGGIRRKYGGTTGVSSFRKGDLVRSPKWIGFVSGEKADGAPSISDANWKRLGYVSAKKVELIRRSTGLICA